jgi:hypothetical protein
MMPDSIRYQLEMVLGKSPTALLHYLLEDRMFFNEHRNLPKTPDGQIYVYETSPRIERITGIPTRTQQRAFKVLVEHNLISIYHRPIEKYNAPRKVVIIDSNVEDLLVNLNGRRAVMNYGDRVLRPFLISVPKWHIKEKRTRTRETTRGTSLEGQSGTQYKGSKGGSTRPPFDRSKQKPRPPSMEIGRGGFSKNSPLPDLFFDMLTPSDTNMIDMNVFHLYRPLCKMDRWFRNEYGYTIEEDCPDIHVPYCFLSIDGGNVEKGGYECFTQPFYPLYLLETPPAGLEGEMVKIEGVTENGHIFKGWTLLEFVGESYIYVPDQVERKLVDLFENEFGTPYYKIDGYQLQDLTEEITNNINHAENRDDKIRGDLQQAGMLSFDAYRVNHPNEDICDMFEGYINYAFDYALENGL